MAKLLTILTRTVVVPSSNFGPTLTDVSYILRLFLRQTPDTYHELCHDRFSPHPFLFIIYRSFSNRPYKSQLLKESLHKPQINRRITDASSSDSKHTINYNAYHSKCVFHRILKLQAHICTILSQNKCYDDSWY